MTSKITTFSAKQTVRIFTIFFSFLLMAVSAQAATLTVTKTADTNDGVCNSDCSLREAIAVATSGDTITFSSLFNTPQTIALSPNIGFQTLVVTKSLTINGSGANLLKIERQVSNQFRIFNINGSGVTVNLNNLTVSNGDTDVFFGGGINANAGVRLNINGCHIVGNAAAQGGGVYITADSTVSISNSTISANQTNGTAATGSGIHNLGVLTVTNSTISGNSANTSDNNGGIWTNNTMTVIGSTITDNQVVGTNSAGGIFRSGNTGTVTISNTIVAANRNNSTMPDVVGAFISTGYNLIGNRGTASGFNGTGDQTGSSAALINPNLNPLALNGGTTPTHSLKSNSPALDKGKSFVLTTDQRGLARPVDLPASNASGGDGADIGAFEAQATPTNQAPTANPDSYTFDEDGSINASAPGVLSNDTDPEGNTLTATIVTTPSHGGLNFFSNGSFIYRPIMNYYGTDSFTYKVNDGTSDSNVTTVSITINSLNDIPIALNDSYDLRPNTTLTVPSLGVLQNDTDVESPLTAIQVSSPSHGTLALNLNGGFTYTPAQNFTGSDSFTYKANDGTADSSVATVNILVNTPTQWIVTSIADTTVGACDADCTLREAIAAAAPGDEIVFASPLFDTQQTITLTNATGFNTLVIGKSLKITGRGANLLTVRRNVPGSSLNEAFRIFNVNGSGVQVTISGMTISGGHAYLYDGAGINNNSGSTLTVIGCNITGNNSFGFGAGIENTSDSTLTVIGSTISNNTAGSHTLATSSLNARGGAGIDNRGTLTVINSTISGNFKNNSNQSSDFNGGGVYTSGRAIITSSTIANNRAVGNSSASGIYNDNAAVTIRNSIVAAAVMPAADIAGSAFTSQGYNLIGNAGTAFGFGATGDQVGSSSFAGNKANSLEQTAVINPLIEPLGMYGGTVPTHRLQTNSPAIDKGNSFGITTDQRGSLRPSDIQSIPNLVDGADIGAYEFQAAPTAAMVSVSGRVLTPEGYGLRNAVVTLTDQSGNSRTVITSSFGYYSLAEVEAGESYIISITSKRYVFRQQFVSIVDDVTGLDFTATQASNRY